MNNNIIHGYIILNRIQFHNNVYVIDYYGIKCILKQYNDLTSFNNEDHYGQIASENDISPKIYVINNEKMFIISELMNPLVNGYGQLVDDDILTPEFISLIDIKITKMHKLGFAHGDLSHFNIIHKNNEPFIIDFENAYMINNHTLDVESWMEDGFDWVDSYSDFVNYDYLNWRQMLNLSTINIPYDNVPISEEDLHQEYLLSR